MSDRKSSRPPINPSPFKGIYLCGHGWMSLEDGKQVLLKQIFADKVRELREAKAKP